MMLTEKRFLNWVTFLMMTWLGATAFADAMVFGGVVPVVIGIVASAGSVFLLLGLSGIIRLEMFDP
jgi:hypothetical protein